MAKDGCKNCLSNSSAQATIFGDDLSGSKSRCNNPACFREKQRAWLTEHWPDGYNDFGTTGFIFDDEFNQCKFNVIYEHHIDSAKKRNADIQKCLTCQSHITVLELTGKVRIAWGKICTGEKACYEKIYHGESEFENTSFKTSANHGPEFQDRFYRESIPERFMLLKYDDARALRMTLFALLYGDYNAKCRFAKENNLEGYQEDVTRKIWIALEAMPVPLLHTWIRNIVCFLLIDNPLIAQGPIAGGLEYKPLIAKHLGIHIETEWVITEEYLKKKRIPELIELGNSLGIFTDEKAVAFLANTIKEKKFENCKKKDLIRVFMESEVDLTGRIPEEILQGQVGCDEPPESDKTEEEE